MNEIGRAMNRKVRAGQCICIHLCLLLLANARQYVGVMRGLVEIASSDMQVCPSCTINIESNEVCSSCHGVFLQRPCCYLRDTLHDKSVQTPWNHYTPQRLQWYHTTS
ncbi:uncharacterized protein F5147DRAFT_715821 [Suillus discolor]|uniref:Uncharacterized protein n=1 Tax=Suillus discolor TaxID=1912936 RepID=A0A9P7EZL8_9AGAM|nr:uncharacterized protein F5147DRAFT_715821 [Suillus discolor]KAG2097033.1 hypothetical protein F5147DRAFT_715821 [Suillus discolor]